MTVTARNDNVIPATRTRTSPFVVSPSNHERARFGERRAGPSTGSGRMADKTILVIRSERAVSVIALFICLAVTLLLCSCFATSVSLTEAEVADDIYIQVNEERQNAGLAELARDHTLDELAQRYSASMFSSTVEQQSDLQYLLCNSWWSTYSGWSPRLSVKTGREQVAYCLENQGLREAMFRSDAKATGVGVAAVGEKVYYAQVFDVLNALSGVGEPLKLHENALARDPSWQELRTFVLNDNTDEHQYVPDSFVCADFAAMLHDRAEAAGIRAAYVSVDLADGPGHALDAFNTTDRGLVFIDCNGPGLNIATSEAIDSRDVRSDYDKVAYVSTGHEYGLISLDRASQFSYAFYEQREQQWQDYKQQAELYKAKSDAYAQALGGRTVVSDPAEHARIEAMYRELQALRKDLEAREAVLGSYRWEPMGIVTSFYVHW